MNQPIYFDNHATTPLDPKVFEVMEPFFKEHFGNASSSNHAFGWAAKAAVEAARKKVADLIGAEPREIYFTSGATESNNLAIQGLARSFPNRKHLVISAIEHESVADVARNLEKQGYQITRLPVDSTGRVSSKDVESAIKSDTLLVSVMAANNEIGSIQPIEQIAKICREKEVYFHTDAVQATGKVKIDVKKMQIDLLSLSGHKIYGPKGVGAIYVSRKDPRVSLEAMTFGGGQERALRPGTLNVPSIVGLGEACLVASQNMESENERLLDYRTRILSALQKSGYEFSLNGSEENRLCGNLNLTFKGIKNDSLMSELRNVAFSAGSACATEKTQGSPVLRALGLNSEQINSTIRIGLGRFNTEDEVEYFIDRIITVLGTHLTAQNIGLFQDPELRKTWRIQEDAYSHLESSR